MALDMTSAAFALKRLWPRKRIARLLYEDQPLLALMQKDETFRGEGKYIPLVYGAPQGRSATFSKAKTNKGSTKGERFFISRVKDYSLFSVDGETIDAADGNSGAVIDAFDEEMEGAFQSIRRSLGISMFRDGSGVIGRRASVSGSTVTLTDPTDISHFEKGMVIQANPNATGNSGTIRSGTHTVTAVDRDAGTYDFTGTITSFADNDYLYQDGDYDGKVKGLDAWIPSSVTSTSFFGVDRTSDKRRLGGLRFDGSSMAVDEALLKGMAMVDREGGRVTHWFVDHGQWLNLEYALGTKVQYVGVSIPGIEVGFEGIKIRGPKGPAIVLADINCQNTIAWGLQLNTWTLHSLKGVPRMLNWDGNQVLRESDADAYEGRIGYYAQQACDAPGYNIRVTLASNAI